LIPFSQLLNGTLPISRIIKSSSENVNITREPIPTEYSLEQNYPNPFNPATVISYKLPTASKVMLKIYDILGKEISTLVNEYKEAGSYDVTFNASKFASGVYIYKIEAGSFNQSKKMILAK